MNVALDYLDDNLDYSSHAIEQTRRMSLRNRRLGLGIMGLADALIKMGLRYGSAEANEWIESLAGLMSETALVWSERAAYEKGEPEWSRDARAAGLIKTPRRNVATLTVAPTGTTAMLMGASSGLEPIFSPFIYRKVGAEYIGIIHPLLIELLEAEQAPEGYATPDGKWDWEKAQKSLEGNHGSVQGLDWVPTQVARVFVCAHDVTPEQHVKTQGAVQRGFDKCGNGNSLSKTINLPNEATIQDVLDAYMLAWEEKCKGVTVYRDGSRSFQVLSTSSEGADKVQEELDASCASGACEKPSL